MTVSEVGLKTKSSIVAVEHGSVIVTSYSTATSNVVDGLLVTVNYWVIVTVYGLRSDIAIYLFSVIKLKE